MIARLTTGQVPPDRLETALAQVRDQLATVLGMDGCKASHLLCDRKSGKIVGLSLWESEDKLRASEAAMNQLRDQVVQTARATTPASSEVFEVID